MKFVILICFSVLISTSHACRNSWSQDWTGLRGNDGRGTIQPNSLLSRPDAVDLQIRWKTRIGSGYSSVVVADGIVVALYTETDIRGSHSGEDVAVGIDGQTGKILWRFSLGPFFQGKNGSFNGPLATPVIHKGRLYALTPRGRLFCLDLKTGFPSWSRDLKKEERAPIPNYGFTTSPIVVEDVLVVQVGAKGRSIIGFDLESGESKWAVGDDAVSSQTPQSVVLEGRPIVLAVGSHKLLGIDPVNGKIVLEYEHHGVEFSAATPVEIGAGRWLLTIDGSYSIAVEIKRAEDSFQVSEVWKSRSIKNSYNIPLFVDGNVFGFSTRFLTCIDPATGRANWKSRSVGDGFLIAIDSHLVVATKKGSLHIATASADGYHEIASAQVFDDLVWSVPAYSDGSIFLRSLGEIARVDIVPDSDAARAKKHQALPLGPEFSSFLAEVAAVSSDQDKAMIVDRFLEAHPIMPIIEGGIVHFVYRGSSNDVAIGSDLFGSRQEKKMIQLDGTDLFYYSVKLPPDQRANYYFLTDFRPTIDPRNPRTITSSVYRGEMEFEFRVGNEPRLKMSWFAMPKWKQPDYLPVPKNMAGKVKEYAIGNEGTNVSITVYTPPGYESHLDRDYPVAYIFGGATVSQHGDLVEIIDSIYQLQNKTKKEIAPECVVVIIKNRPMELLDPGMIPGIVVPFIDETYKTIKDRDGRLVVGFGFDGSTALAALADNPELFATCGVQSPMVFEFFREPIIQGFKSIDRPVNVLVEWGRFDTYSPDENWDMRSLAQSLVDRMKENKNVTIRGGMVNDSTGWSSWRNRIDRILQMLNK